jgi:hypothetical protein
MSRTSAKTISATGGSTNAGGEEQIAAHVEKKIAAIRGSQQPDFLLAYFTAQEYVATGEYNCR